MRQNDEQRPAVKARQSEFQKQEQAIIAAQEKQLQKQKDLDLELAVKVEPGEQPKMEQQPQERQIVVEPPVALNVVYPIGGNNSQPG